MFRAYARAIGNYFNFHDRARRRDYWLFLIANAIIAGVLGVVLNFVAQKTGNTQTVDLAQYGLGQTAVMSGWPASISNLYSLFIAIPSLALLFRRLHDMNKSGWSILWLLLPIVGWLIFIIPVLFKRGTRGENKYGEDPRR